MNLVIKISLICYHEQNFSLLFYSTFQENMSFYQKSLFKYNISHFIKTSFSWLSSMRSHSAYHAVKQDHFFQNFTNDIFCLIIILFFLQSYSSQMSICFFNILIMFFNLLSSHDNQIWTCFHSISWKSLSCQYIEFDW